MKILFVVENYYPHIGGVEVVFKNLAEGLAAKGHSVVVVTHRMKGASKEEVLNGVKIIRISCKQSRYIFSFAAIPRALKEAKNADVIHTTTFNGAFPAWLVSKLRRKKCVITVHEVWLGKWREYTTMGRVGALLHELLERALYVLPFNHYVAVSNSTRSQLKRIGKKNVTTIYNSVDYDHFNQKKYNRMKVRKELGFEGFVCLTLGRPGPSKGIEYAIQAVPYIHVENMHYLFILSKDRQYLTKHESLRKLMSNLKHQHKITLINPVPHADLPKYLLAADCIVIPSLSEGFGYVAAESSAMGTPMVVTKTTSLPEVVSGRFVFVPTRSSSAIATAIEKVARREYETAPLKKFTLDNNIKNYLTLYRSL